MVLNTEIEVYTKDNDVTKDGKMQWFSVDQGKTQRMKKNSDSKKREENIL